ncbi:MAG: multicopper oxidase domain-containing protein, partial [Nitrospira sp.]
MHEQARGNNHGRDRCKVAALLGLTLGMVASMAMPVEAKTHDIQMTAVETDIVIDGGGEKYAAWTFNGQFPGPVVRVTEGDTGNFTLTNPST